MVKLRKIGHTYYARIRLPKSAQKTERLITLKTRDKETAHERLSEVKLFADEIKQGQEMTFSWQSQSGKAEFKNSTLGELTANYLEHRKTDIEAPVRTGTFALMELHVGKFLEYFGESKKVSSINQAEIIAYKKEITSQLALATSNINFRIVRTMWNHFRKMKYNVQDLEFKQIAVPHRKPLYFSNAEFESILEVVDPYLQRVFCLYRDTAMRLREGINGVLSGNFLLVPPELSKGKRERVRRIELPPSAWEDGRGVQGLAGFHWEDN